MNDVEPTLQEYAVLGRELISKAIRQDRSSAIRRRVVISTAAGVLAVGGMGAAWVALANPALRTNAAYCYGEADPSSSFVGAGAPDPEARDGSFLQRDVDPIDLCSAVWRIGAVGPHATQPPVDGTYYDVPNLTACLRLDGVIAVFPNEQYRVDDAFCREFGLTPYQR